MSAVWDDEPLHLTKRGQNLLILFLLAVMFVTCLAAAVEGQNRRCAALRAERAANYTEQCR